MFLGLKGSEDEIADAFKKVNANNSGLIDKNGFIEAIRGERMLELSLRQVLKKMGVQYDKNVNVLIPKIMFLRQMREKHSRNLRTEVTFLLSGSWREKAQSNFHTFLQLPTQDPNNVLHG